MVVKRLRTQNRLLVPPIISLYSFRVVVYESARRTKQQRSAGTTPLLNMTNDTASPVDESTETSKQTMTRTDVREYHKSIQEAVAPLGSVDTSQTLLVNDKKGWYVTRDNEDPDYADEEGGTYPKERRPRQFAKDYTDTVANRLERTLYALTSYKHPDVFEQWEPARFNDDDGGYEYHDQKPTPTVEDITAISTWGDIDLADELKPQRPNLDSSTYEVAEETYEAYIQSFADLYGGRDAVYMLDSVGGAYIFGAPEAVLPIAQYYADDIEARSWVFNEFVERTYDYLNDAEDTINEEIEGASEVIHPDWANNINRQYKIPLTLHGDHDAVVTPVDTENVRYREPTPVNGVDDELRDEVRQWCESFTAIEYEDRVEILVETLWPDEFDETGSWEDALDLWVEKQREKARREEQRQQAAAERRAQRLEELGEGIEGTPITPFLQDVYDALNGIDTAEVTKHYASDEWDSGADMPNKIEFNPSWRSSKSGRSCYVNEETNRFGDPGDSGGGYAAKAMALGEGIITSASDDLVGEDWGEAVEALRNAGYDVPIWTPEKGSRRHDGTSYEKMPFWAVKKAAVALGVVPENSFVEQTTDEDNTYLGFPGTDSYTNALEAIEEAGLEHGRSRSAEHNPNWVSEPVTEVSLEPREEVALSDEELLAKAKGAGNGDTFTPLWEGEASKYSTPARADLALCSLLAFWTGGDGTWMDQLYRQSGLMREKWDEQIGSEEGDTETDLSYGSATIRHALKQKEDFYSSPSQPTVSDTSTAAEVPSTKPDTTADTSSQSEELSEQHAQLKSKVDSLKEDLEEKEARVEHLQTVQTMREDKIEYLQKEVSNLESENADLKDRIAKLREKNPADNQSSPSETEPDRSETESGLRKEGTLAASEDESNIENESAT